MIQVFLQKFEPTLVEWILNYQKIFKNKKFNFVEFFSIFTKKSKIKIVKIHLNTLNNCIGIRKKNFYFKIEESKISY